MAPGGLTAGSRRHLVTEQFRRRLPGPAQRLSSTWHRLEEPLELARDAPLATWLGLRNRRELAGARAFVMFVGYPRSGHSIVASLLNAHPDVVIGQRIRVLRHVGFGYRRLQVQGMVMLAEHRFSGSGRIGSKRYDYSVPGQWQGRFRTIRVLGDGNVTNDTLRARPHLLGRLREVIGLPVLVIHVVRNPFDNIATMSVRNRVSLGAAADRYFDLCDGATAVRADCADEHWADVRHEALLEDPQGCLAGLCRFVGVPPDDDYLDACAGVLYKSPHRSRNDVDWPAELRSSVAERSAAYPFLSGYAFDEPQAPAAR